MFREGTHLVLTEPARRVEVGEGERQTVDVAELETKGWRAHCVVDEGEAQASELDRAVRKVSGSEDGRTNDHNFQQAICATKRAKRALRGYRVICCFA